MTRLALIICVFLFNCTDSSTLSAQTHLLVKSQIGDAWQTTPFTFSAGRSNDITHFGCSVELFRQLNRRLAIGVAPGFMRRGTSYETGFINGLVIGPRFQSSLHLNYLQLPFYLKATFPLYRKLGFLGQTGLGYSYLMGGFREVTTIAFIQTPLQHLELDFSERDEELNRFALGWHSSLGLSFEVGKGQLVLTYDYYLGFVYVDQKNDSANRNWGIGLGYQFQISADPKARE